MGDTKIDRRITYTFWASIATAVLVVGFVAPALISTRTTTGEVARGNELAACRAEYRAAIDRASAAGSVLVLEGLGALAAGERDHLVRLTDQVAGVQARIADAIDRYDMAVTRSREDPEGFLADCRGGAQR